MSHLLSPVHQRVPRCPPHRDPSSCHVPGTILPPAHHLLPSAGPRWWEEGGTCLSPNPFSHISHISLLPKSDICAKGTWAIIYRWVLSLGREQFPKCLVATSITSCAETTLTQPAALGLRLVVKLCFLQ